MRKLQLEGKRPTIYKADVDEIRVPLEGGLKLCIDRRSAGTISGGPWFVTFHARLFRTSAAIAYVTVVAVFVASHLRPVSNRGQSYFGWKIIVVKWIDPEILRSSVPGGRHMRYPNRSIAAAVDDTQAMVFGTISETAGKHKD